jgi:hypothetical protein
LVRDASVPHPQLVVFREAQKKPVGHRLDLLEPHIDDHAAHAVRRDRMDERRVLHAVIAAEGRHHAAQALGPVAGPERLAVESDALDDEFDDLALSHILTLRHILWHPSL